MDLSQQVSIVVITTAEKKKHNFNFGIINVLPVSQIQFKVTHVTLKVPVRESFVTIVES